MNRPPSPHGRRGGTARAARQALPPIFVGAAIALLLLALAVPAAAESWRFEAEDISPWSCHTAGVAVSVVACSEASGGYALEGLSMLGDWAEIGVTFGREICFIDSIRCASPVGSEWQFLVEFRPEDRPETVVARSEHSGVTGRGLG
jgi:hypothetical protein